MTNIEIIYINGSNVKNLFLRFCRNIHCLNMPISKKTINILCSYLQKKGFNTQIINGNYFGSRGGEKGNLLMSCQLCHCCLKCNTLKHFREEDLV